MPARAGVDVLVAVGPRAAHLADGYGDGDRRRRRAGGRRDRARACWSPATPCSLKGSRGVGLEVVARTLEGD